jgi:hypothetical protein
VRVQNSAGRDYLTLYNCSGTAANPIRIVNWEGQVVIDASTNSRGYCLDLTGCTHCILDGWGDAEAWGFKLTGFTNTGLWIHDTSENITVYGIEIADDDASNPGAGIRAGTRLTDASPGFVVDDLEFHDCYIHDVGQEAMYIGNDSTDSQYPIDGLIVEYNRIISCHWGGIQIRNATNVSCRRNWIYDCGPDVDGTHAGGGLNLGTNTIDAMSGDWWENRIEYCERGIHQLTGDADVRIHHNLIYNCGDNGPHGDQDGYKPQNSVDAAFKFYKNTIIDSKEYGIDTRGTDGEIEDCIVCGSGNSDIDSLWTLDSNETGTTASQNFRASDVWYHLTATSPAVGAAHDGTDCGWIDYN